MCVNKKCAIYMHVYIHTHLCKLAFLEARTFCFTYFFIYLKQYLFYILLFVHIKHSQFFESKLARLKFALLMAFSNGQYVIDIGPQFLKRIRHQKSTLLKSYGR